MSASMTLNTLVTAVKEHLNMPNTSPSNDGNPSNTRIKRAINAEIDAIRADLSATFKRRFATTTTLTYAADAESTALPAAVQNQQVIQIEARASSATSTSNYKLDELTVEEFRNYAVTGVPRYFAQLGTAIRLRPIPTVEQTLTIFYDAATSDLSDGDADAPTWLNAKFHPLIALGAAIRLRRSMDDPYVGLKEQYDDDYLKMVVFYQAMFKDNHSRETEDLEDRYG